MKRRIFDLSLFLALFISVACCVSFESDCENIRDSVLRLHIIADSDSAEAQKLKYEVRDRIIAEGTELFKETDNIDLVKQCAEKNLHLLEKAASETVKEKGYTYPVRAELTRCYFPTRKYGSTVFPAGEYEALRIIIGEGKGQNWWCVMFPPMCLPAASEKEELSDVLDEKELEIVTEPNKYRVRLWVVEKWYEVKEYFQKE